MNSKVDTYFETLEQWKSELALLRAILLECGLVEDLKWSSPCFTHKIANICIIGGFKTNCVISFFKGVLLQDTEKILSKPGENSETVRIVRFTDLQQIKELKPFLKAYIFEAIEIEKMGLKLEPKKVNGLVFPDELRQKFSESPAFKAAFDALSLGRQRAYNIHFSGAKQPKSRVNRIENYREKIMNGKGFNDCICGLSKKMPSCDGSHKYLNV